MSTLAAPWDADDLWDQDTHNRPVRSVFAEDDSVYLPPVQITDPTELRRMARALRRGEHTVVLRLDELVEPDPNAYRNPRPGGMRIETRLVRYEIRLRRRVNGVLSVNCRTSEHRLGLTGSRFNPSGSTMDGADAPEQKRFSAWTTTDVKVLTLGVDGCWLLARRVPRKRNRTPVWARTYSRTAPQRRMVRWITRRVYAETRPHLHIGLSQAMSRVAEAVLGRPASLHQRYPLLQGYIDRCFGDDAHPLPTPEREANRRAQRLVEAMNSIPPDLLACLRDTTSPETVATRLLGPHHGADLVDAVKDASLQGLNRAALFAGLVNERCLRSLLTSRSNFDQPRRITTAAMSRRVMRHLDQDSRHALAADMLCGDGWSPALGALTPAPSRQQWKALERGDISLGPVATWAELQERLFALRTDLGSGLTGRATRLPAILRQVEGRTASGLRLRLARRGGDSWRWAAELGASPGDVRAMGWDGSLREACCCVRDERGRLVAVAMLTQPSQPGDVDGYLIGPGGSTLAGSAIAWEVEDHLVAVEQHAVVEGRPGWTSAWATSA